MRPDRSGPPGGDVELAARFGPGVGVCRRALTGEAGTRLPPFVDHHVHTHLIDEARFSAHGIAGVVDLGGDPVALARRPSDAVPRVAYAGAFLTARGGYPAGRSWAPASVVRELTSASVHPGVPGGAITAVDEQVSFGASLIKIALHADAGPVLDDAVVRAVVAAARAHSVPVVAHVQGTGMARRAIDAGIGVLAHTPFSERLDGALLARAAAAGQRWISTLDILRDDAPTRETARANLAAFIAAGGSVLYGTDLGNGDLPVGVNAREIAALQSAGVFGAALIRSMSDPWPLAEPVESVATFVPGNAPRADDDVPEWLARATVVPIEELTHDDL